MAKFDVLDMNGKKVSEVELSDAVFGITPNERVMHAVVAGARGMKTVRLCQRCIMSTINSKREKKSRIYKKEMRKAW